MIARVHHMLDDTVMVFNEKGKLMYQGKFDKMIGAIKMEANGSTKFYVVGLVFPVNRDLFYSKDYWNYIKTRRI
jgi:hypothetical protein